MECDYWLFIRYMVMPMLIVLVVEYILIRYGIKNEYAGLVERNKGGTN